MVLLSTYCLVDFSVFISFAHPLTLSLLCYWCHTLDHIYVFLYLVIAFVDRRIVNYVFSIPSFIMIIRRWSKSLSSCPGLIMQLVLLLYDRFNFLYVLFLLFLRNFLDCMLLNEVLLSKLVEEIRMPCLLILSLIFLLVAYESKLTLHGRWIFVFSWFCWSPRIWANLRATIFRTRRKPHHLLMILEREIMIINLWWLLSSVWILLLGTLHLILGRE